MSFLSKLFGRKKGQKQSEPKVAPSPPIPSKPSEVEDFVEVFPSDMDPATAMAYCREAAQLRAAWKDRKDLARVEGIYRAVTKACPDFWIGHFGLGEVLTMAVRRNTLGALTALQQAVQLAPGERPPLLELARELSGSKFDDAIAYYTEAVKLSPSVEEEIFYPSKSQAGAHWEIAIAAATKGQEILAIEAFQRAIELNPNRYISAIRPESPPAVNCWRRAVEQYESKMNAKAVASNVADNRCNRCGKDLGTQWHYPFESILIAQNIGLQCPDCGNMLCSKDSREGDKQINDCPKCGNRLVQLMEGPALSSMVDQARHESRYRGAIKEPSILDRPVEMG